MKVAFSRFALATGLGLGLVAWSAAQTLPLLAAAVAQGPTAPVYQVTKTGLTLEETTALADSLRLKLERMGDGSVRYVDPAALHFFPNPIVERGEDEEGQPTVSQKLDFEAMRSFKPLDRSRAISRLRAALLAAKIPVGNAAFIPSNTEAEVYDAKGTLQFRNAIDTTVHVEFNLKERPLVGPGSKIKAIFDGRGALGQLLVNTRQLRELPAVSIISEEEALRRARARLGNANAKLKARLVYFAPPLDAGDVKFIRPHWEISPLDNGNEENPPIRTYYMPAQTNGLRVDLRAAARQTLVDGQAVAAGGRLPYSFSFASSSVELPTPNPTNRIRYRAFPQDRSTTETLSVTVTDADGNVATDSETLDMVPPGGRNFFGPGTDGAVSAMGASNIISAGIEYVGQTYPNVGLNALGLTAGNANNLRSRLIGSGIPVSVYYTEASAWESDWTNAAFGGSAHLYMDNVDLSFFTGHASSGGFNLSSNHFATVGRPAKMRLGRNDLEWAVFGVCLLLSNDGVPGSAIGRWGQVFDGLHMICSYDTVSNDTDQEGAEFARWALGTWPFPALPIRSAWVMAASSTQPSSVRWGFMYVVSTSGISNYNDFFWGRGSVGPDIPASSIGSYVIVRGNC